jgi:hypothetical protein
MDCYDELYARAKKAAKRKRRRLELEALKSGDNNPIHQQSDSELSVLASSLFDGMEGIQSETSPRRTWSGKEVKYRDD